MNTKIRTLAAVAALAPVALGVASCKGSSPKHQAEAHKAEASAKAALSSQQGKRDKARVERCVKAGGGHVAVWHCISPKGSLHALFSCTISAYSTHQGGKAGLEQRLTTCLLDHP